VPVLLPLALACGEPSPEAPTTEPGASVERVVLTSKVQLEDVLTDHEDRLALAEAAIVDLVARVEALEAENAAQQAVIDALAPLADKVSVDAQGDVVFTATNLRLVNGSGATNGAANGLGNLIVGYDEPSATLDRGGSHNVVIGREHDYPSYGGLVVGHANAILGPYAFAAGVFNVASGNHASVCGGNGNVASANYATITGGLDNSASARGATVVGGEGNDASGDYSVVLGATGVVTTLDHEILP
jgi:hypothetical protein